ncbi:DUF4405 domain-containing protein [Shewanella bicestrii]|nr:DUF4405 domain-containing protein [Shewanella bicestrii]
MKLSRLMTLLLPCVMLTFLLLSLAYWWLENVPHEIFGSLFFMLLTWHIARHKSWLNGLLKGRYDKRRIVMVLLHAALLVNMIILLVTSIVISKTVFGFLPIDSIYLREIHWFSAYWVMVITGIHVGIHWARVMGLSRALMKLNDNAYRKLALRIAVVAIVGIGVWSFSVLGIWTKLTFTYSLDVWNFKTSVTPFFGHWLTVIALPAVVTHYAMKYWCRQSRLARNK